MELDDTKLTSAQTTERTIGQIDFYHACKCMIHHLDSQQSSNQIDLNNGVSNVKNKPTIKSIQALCKKEYELCKELDELEKRESIKFGQSVDYMNDSNLFSKEHENMDEKIMVLQVQISAYYDLYEDKEEFFNMLGEYREMWVAAF